MSEEVLSWTWSPFGSFWVQLTRLFFLLAASFNDVLVIRVFLVLGWTIDLLVAVTGATHWPHVVDKEFEVSLDGICWGLFSLYVAGSSLYSLIQDEMPVIFTPRQDQVWRFFYRLSGMTRIMFEEYVLPFGRFCDFQPGETIFSDSQAKDPSTEGKVVHLIIGGYVRVDLFDDSNPHSVHLTSGDMFPFKFFNLATVHVGFLLHNYHAVAATKTTTFAISLRALDEATKSGGAMLQAWHSVIVSSVGRAAEVNNVTIPFRNADQQMRSSWMTKYQAVGLDKRFQPLRASELPSPTSPGSGQCLNQPVKNFFKLCAQSVQIPLPFSKLTRGFRSHSVGLSAPDGERAAKVVRLGESKRDIAEKNRLLSSRSLSYGSHGAREVFREEGEEERRGV